jgi:hypothetical protein
MSLSLPRLNLLPNPADRPGGSPDRRIAGIARSPLDLPTAGHSSFRAVGPMYDLAKYSSRDGGATYTEKRWTSSFDYGVGAERYQRNLIDYSVQFAAWFRLRDEIL